VNRQSFDVMSGVALISVLQGYSRQRRTISHFLAVARHLGWITPCRSVIYWGMFCVYRCSRIPRYVLLENVKGFESSAMRNELIQTLNSLQYQCQVTPL